MVKNKTIKSVPGRGESFVLSLPPAKKAYRPTVVQIDTGAFLKNIAAVRSILEPKTKMLAVVKANAYGHMAIPLLRLAEKHFAMLGVSSIEEGIALRDGGIKKDILIMGSIYPLENLNAAYKYNLTPTISSLDGLRELSGISLKLKKTLSYHLKVDTGMGRVGISAVSAAAFLDKSLTFKGVRLDGIYTHFASAGTDPEYTRNQLDQLKTVVDYAKKLKIKCIAHAANSDAIFLYPYSHLDMVRPGLSLYGLWHNETAAPKIKLEPVLSWKTKIIFLKKVKEGTAVSYGKTFVAKRPSAIATLPVGYADGLNRNLSNKGIVLIRGKRCPIVGRVTMDMIMVDVTGVEGADVGDEAVLIGRQGVDELTVKDMADAADTITYEIICSIGYRVPRVLV